MLKKRLLTESHITVHLEIFLNNPCGFGVFALIEKRSPAGAKGLVWSCPDCRMSCGRRRAARRGEPPG